MSLPLFFGDPFAGSLPEPFPLNPAVPHAPNRSIACLSEAEIVLAIKNALRYVPERWRKSFHALVVVF